MKVTPTAIPDVLIIEPEVFGDERGFFYESFNKVVFQKATGIQKEFVQDNHSRSQRGVLRGLHYQLPPDAQGKLVRVVHGEVWDVAVDIRSGSPSFGQWIGEYLSARNTKQLWIPPGFAHGFLVLSEFAEVFYKTTSVYSLESERCILWSDQSLKIAWPLQPLISLHECLIISEKDRLGHFFEQAETFETSQTYRL